MRQGWCQRTLNLDVMEIYERKGMKGFMFQPKYCTLLRMGTLVALATLANMPVRCNAAGKVSVVSSTERN